MDEIKLDDVTITKVIEDVNLYMFNNSEFSLEEMKNINQILRITGGIIKNVKVSISC